MKLPGDDRELSPHTGFTRDHWVAAADGLLDAAWRWATPQGALLDLPGPPSKSGVRSDGLEGYARTFLAAAFRVAGSNGDDPHGRLDRYASGLVAGTLTPGRDDAESWPLIRDHTVFGQPMVESASVALGLRLTRPWLWDRLDNDAKDRAEEWLRGALRHVPAPNNWYLFPYTVAGFLESVGRADAETARARSRALELLETWYRGQGWYADGDGRAFDHYNGWALHLYPVLDAHLAGTTGVHGSRLREHLESFGLLFDSNGAPIHFGRSLTYRFAAASAVGLGAVTGHTPLTPGESRRVISGALRYFLDRGSVGPDGLLSLGWHGPHAATLQNYSGPASPYWAAKAFVCLLADDDHPLWTSTEDLQPDDRVLALPAPGLLIQTTADGIVRLHNHGSDHVKPDEAEVAAGVDPHYSRLAYSTRTGPTAKANHPDNHFCVRIGDARSVRRRMHPIDAQDTWAASWHLPAFPDIAPMVPGLKVESVTVASGPYELRVHRVTGAPHGAWAEETGWATGPDDPLTTFLTGIHGWTDQDEARAPQGTAFTPWARMPRLCAPIAGTTIFAAIAVLAETEPEVDAEVPEATADEITVRWAGGVTTIGFEPFEVRRTPG
ncbi:DUF2264 domain-containing protein [Actinocrispum sp. NPDC049592]|uniref:DUF2264 domain-containing protein n=1 Tax=Actinocrispum sp. NPDC049592 TaxID=3154835 RepID=UPI0034246CF2